MVIVVAILSVYVVFFKEKENEESFSLGEYEGEDTDKGTYIKEKEEE